MKITIIGAGNVATQLTKRLHKKGHQILQVFNRNVEAARRLTEAIDITTATNNWNDINLDSDVYLIAISDDAIDSVATKLATFIPSKAIVAHTSGATSSKVFNGYFENYGVFYPLQTFSKNRQADFQKLPFCIDGSNEHTQNQLVTLAKSICPNIYLIDDKQRSVLHVAAVFANNFTNYLLTVSEDILNQENIPFDLLKPLINETVAKINSNPPKSMQTGPARRGDKATLKKHQEYLEETPSHHLIYKLLSMHIEALYDDKKA